MPQKYCGVQDQTAQQKEIFSRKKTICGGEPHTCCSWLQYTNLQPADTMPADFTPSTGFATELWFNNPCTSSDLQEQLVELQEELQKHNCGVNVPVPQLKWFMQHLVTTMSAIIWLSSLNQSLKHYTEFVYLSKPKNTTYPWKFRDLYSPEKLSITHVLVEKKLGKKYPCAAGWSISYHLSGFKPL